MTSFHTLQGVNFHSGRQTIKSLEKAIQIVPFNDAVEWAVLNLHAVALEDHRRRVKTEGGWVLEENDRDYLLMRR